MEKWLAHCQDRHTDPVCFIRGTRQEAIDEARSFMRETVAYPDELEEEELPDGRWYMTYNLESDHAWVMAIDVGECS